MVRLGAADVHSEDDVAGFNVPLPGRYHAVVNAVDESFSEFDKIVVEFAILRGTVPGQEQKTLREFFSVQGADDKKTIACLKRLQRLALVLGLIQPGQEEEDVSFEAALGRQLVIEVEENNYKDKDGNEKKSVRVAYMGFWSAWNPAVKDVPFDEEARKSVPVPAAFGGNGAGGPPAAGVPTPQPTPQPTAPSRARPATKPAAAQSPPASASGDEWADV